MSEVTDLTVIEIKPEQAPVLYVAGGLDAYLEQIRQAVNEVPDLSTKKGRDRVASLAAQVSRSKTAIEKPGREYLKRLKEAVRPAEAEIKRFVDACDELRDATRRPLTEWEAEQERIKAEEAMNAMHAEALEMNIRFDQELAAKFEADHEMALLMNKDFDRDREEQRRQAEQAQRERDERLKQEAAEQARRDAEAKHKAEIEAERLKAKRAEQARRDAEAKHKAEIEAERLKAKRAEDARLAEEKRIADEAAARAANIAHQKRINNEAKDDFVKGGIPEEFARKAVELLAKRQVRNSSINY